MTCTVEVEKFTAVASIRKMYHTASMVIEPSPLLFPRVCKSSTRFAQM